MSHLRFYRATLSRDKMANVTWHVVRLCSGRATSFPNRAVLRRENALNADWSILVYATKLLSVRHAQLRNATLSRDNVARQSCRCDIGLTLTLLMSYLQTKLCFNSDEISSRRAVSY